MKNINLISYLFATIIAIGLALPLGAVQAETLVGSNVDSRVQVGFSVSAESLKPWLPADWTPAPFPGGALKGANLLLILIDRDLELDPDGKPKSPSKSRAAAFVGLGKQDGGDTVRLYVYRIYSSAPGYDPYGGNAKKAEIARTTTTEGAANEGRNRQEVWSVMPQDGGELGFSLNFTSGTPSWGPGEIKPHSKINPDFWRIYRYDQLVDLAMSAPVGKPLAGEFSLTSTVPELAGIFDGSEQTIAILDVPVYVRKVYLP